MPGGWWHCVLNLEESLAVTQNYVSDANLARCIRYAARGKAHYFEHVAQYYGPQARAAVGMGEGSEDSGSSDDESGGEEQEERPVGRGRQRGSSSRGRAAEAAGASRRRDPGPSGASSQQLERQPAGRAAKRSKLAPAAESSEQQQAPDGVALLLSGSGLGGSQELGAWLAGLWEGQPQLQPQLLQLSQQELGTAAWGELLQRICAKAQVGSGTWRRCCCLLPAACCLLPAACCLLPAACCLLPAPHQQLMSSA